MTIEERVDKLEKKFDELEKNLNDSLVEIKSDLVEIKSSLKNLDNIGDLKNESIKKDIKSNSIRIKKVRGYSVKTIMVCYISSFRNSRGSSLLFYSERRLSMEEEKNSLAYEILKENKVLTKRLFIICIIEFFIIVGMVVGFFIYESQYQYAEETYQYVDDSEMQNSTINQKLGE